MPRPIRPGYDPVAAEAKRLGSTEGDWKNIGGMSSKEVKGRTRGGGVGRPNLAKRVYNEESSDDETVVAVVREPEFVDEDEDDEDEEDDEVPKKKPPANNLIFEAEAMKDMLDKNCRCSDCYGPVEVSIKTVCIASQVILTCKNKECGFTFNSTTPASANIGNEGSDDRERSTDFAINVNYILGFLWAGDGGTEAGRILGTMGLPNDTTMESRSFPIIEERINSTLEKVAADILLDNLIEEVRLAMEAAGSVTNDFELWKSSVDGTSDVVLHKSKYPSIRVSFDMGWQQRSSGNRYNSASGHAILVGSFTRKAVAMILKSKVCYFCIAWPKNKKNEGLPVGTHYCRRNHEGTSSAMEPAACLEMVVGLYENRNCVVSMIVCDDDASTRSMMRWSNQDHMINNNTTQVPQIPKSKGINTGEMTNRPDRGKLPGHIPEPLFGADPNHRRKVFSGVLIKHKDLRVADRHGMCKMDCTRLQKNFGYMARTLKNRPESEYVAAGVAVLDHHFDDHTHCGAWCPRKRLTPAQILASNRYYRCKTKDAKLYAALKSKVDRFLTLDRLKEIAHGMDTQVNESFNNTVSWMAPKNKVYCGSCSLSNRLAIAVGINSIGLVRFYTRLYKAMGITITPNVMHFLQVKEGARTRRSTKAKLCETKKQRNEKKMEACRTSEKQAHVDRAKKEGTYRKGMNMDEDGADGYTAQDLLEQDLLQQAQEQNGGRPPKKKRKTLAIPAICKHCGLAGHSRRTSSKCLHFKGANSGVPPPIPLSALSAPADMDDELLQLDAAADVDRMDSCPLVPDDDELEDDEFGEFQDALTWSDGEEEPGVI
jgi:hypothetical protein